LRRKLIIEEEEEKNSEPYFPNSNLEKFGVISLLLFHLIQKIPNFTHFFQISIHIFSIPLLIMVLYTTLPSALKKLYLKLFPQM